MTGDAPIDELKALAHPLRFRILQALAQRECNVGEIEDLAEIGQPALSQQLAVLRNAGIVETRKEAKLVFYRLNESRITGLVGAIANLLGQSNAAPATRISSAPGVANLARLS